MRTSADFPRRRRARTTPRSRAWLVVLAIVLFVVITSVRGIAGFYTDYLWYDSLGFSGVFTGVLWAKVALGLIFSGVFFAVLWVNLFIADRIGPRFRPVGPEEEVIERYHEMIGERTGLVRVVVAGIFALITGAGVSAQWRSWILFTNAQDFGVDDPQFGTDIGFYVFRLPFLTFLADWAFASVVIILVVTAVAHYLNGGIRMQGAAQRVTPQVKGHLSVLLGLLALLKAAGYWLQRFELNFSERGTVKGATYTDVNAQLPVLGLLILISLAAFVLFIVNIWRRGWALPVLAVGLWAFAALVMGGIYPALVQRFRVEPSESSREAPYITRNIEATKAAMGLDAVETVPYEARDDLDSDGLEVNRETVRNIRLWDPAVLDDTYQQIQAIRDFYAINDVDVDRYDIDGRRTQVVVSARELNRDGVPQRSWEATHLAFTHGYGAVLAPANSNQSDGRPDLLVRDVPVVTEEGLELNEPGIYVGEGLEGYVVVNTDREEIDFEDADGETQVTQYDGEDGVDIGSFLNRAAFALRFGDVNPLISGNIRSDSKILLQRDLVDRLETLAPFLSFDGDPYPVIIDGEIDWVVDAYTTSGNYPYAQDADTTQLQMGSGLPGSFNYIRNSVKAVVDAYDGTVELFVVDEEDPLIAAYRQAFPELFSDGDDVPEELRAHFRYPEDLFRVQTNVWGRYHVSNPDTFYNQSQSWSVSPDPRTAATTAVTQSADGQTDATTTSRAQLIAPYYQLMRLPGAEEEEFLLLRPFVPVSGSDAGRQLTAFMVAKSDPENYGELQTYTMPPAEDGPPLVAADIQSDAEVSELQTLLCQEGSTCTFGNLLLIPIEQSLLYVQPLYVESTTNRTPELRQVIVSYEGEVEVAETLQQALIDRFGDAPSTLEEAPDPTEPDPGGEDPPPEEPGTEDVAALLAQAQEAFEEAEAILTESGDLGAYQDRLQEAQDLIERALELSGGVPPSETTTTTTDPTA